jgi:alkylation response protein AidB-like acyl-CoA dehydrogenase
MDLEYGSQYEEYKKEVQIFCKKYHGVHFSDAAKTPMATDSNSAGPVVTRSEWQKILIENGYFARSIPKEYGGFGGDSDVIKKQNYSY